MLIIKFDFSIVFRKIELYAKMTTSLCYKTTIDYAKRKNHQEIVKFSFQNIDGKEFLIN